MIEAVVTARRMLGPDTVALDLASADGRPLPPYEAGAHIDLHLGEGLVRQYSLWADPAEAGPYRIAVLRDPASRGGSEAVHRLRPGARLRISAPRNRFALRDPRAHAVLVAGGIGITPLLSMAQALHRTGAGFTLHYCARSRDRAAFADLLAAAPFADRVALHLDDGPAGQRLDLSALAVPPDAGAHLYVCGPEGFMRAVLDAAGGWPRDHLHQERFAAPPETAAAGGDRPFEVRLASGGGAMEVPPGISVLEVLRRAGIDVPHSCEQGICGTCLTRVLDGVPEHRDFVLTDSERAAGNVMALCCSRAATPHLLLDL